MNQNAYQLYSELPLYCILKGLLSTKRLSILIIVVSHQSILFVESLYHIISKFDCLYSWHKQFSAGNRPIIRQWTAVTTLKQDIKPTVSLDLTIQLSAYCVKVVHLFSLSVSWTGPFVNIINTYWLGRSGNCMFCGRTVHGLEMAMPRKTLAVDWVDRGFTKHIQIYSFPKVPVNKYSLYIPNVKEKTKTNGKRPKTLLYNSQVNKTE